MFQSRSGSTRILNYRGRDVADQWNIFCMGKHINLLLARESTTSLRGCVENSGRFSSTLSPFSLENCPQQAVDLKGLNSEFRGAHNNHDENDDVGGIVVVRSLRTFFGGCEMIKKLLDRGGAGVDDERELSRFLRSCLPACLPFEEIFFCSESMGSVFLT